MNETMLSRWEELAKKALRGRDLSSISTELDEGIRLKPFYTEEDLQHIQSFEQPTSPVEWDVCQRIPGQTIEEYKKNLDFFSQRGLNTIYIDELQTFASVGDLQSAFENIDLSNYKIFIDASQSPTKILSFLQYLNEKSERLQGVVGFDPYEKLLLTGHFSYEENIEQSKQLVQWLNIHSLNLKLFLFKGAIYHEAGADAVKELAYTFSAWKEWIDELINHGVSIDDLIDKTAFSFSIGSQFFTEVSKFRAARKIWSNLIKVYGVSKGSRKIYLHAKTAIRNKSILDEQVNLLRTTGEAFSAICANVDGLTILPYNFLTESDSLHGARIAQNTHFLFKEESLLSKVADPAKGSYYIESLSNSLAEKAWALMQEIDEQGGFIQALKLGKVQGSIEKLSNQHENQLYHRQKSMIGVNMYANINDAVTSERTNLNTGFMLSNDKNEMVKKLNPSRLAESYEQLRLKSQKLTENIPIYVVGELKEYKPRLDFVNGILASGGMKGHVSRQFQEKEICILCGTDDDYQQLQDSTVEQFLSIKQLYVVARKLPLSLQKHPNISLISTNMDAYSFLLHMQKQLGGKDYE
ncbi:methylmalonyl-CoA mutase family protein [Bacillus carboniphilus]|uniref:Methylmalonyl-CoA mutase family protein n=1 Tax=Bacillus carboniphilus TaxID=86663 RepID=A0ABY9K205_9BACI|nr:methylmalonyl-CoA mutase family protein [Bacillus carboniphilus]WLR43865.1 methylmalonyl-CoA mutase family protein [Bacillus carboniphilus]